MFREHTRGTTPKPHQSGTNIWNSCEAAMWRSRNCCKELATRPPTWVIPHPHHMFVHSIWSILKRIPLDPIQSPAFSTLSHVLCTCVVLCLMIAFLWDFFQIAASPEPGAERGPNQTAVSSTVDCRLRGLVTRLSMTSLTSARHIA